MCRANGGRFDVSLFNLGHRSQVFGVTVYKFFNRYSRLLEVHQQMEKAGCLATVEFSKEAKFPPKGYFTDYSEEAAKNMRGCVTVLRGKSLRALCVCVFLGTVSGRASCLRI
eukprot:SAG31_NODE_6426_length_2025_cov_0.934579_2_plen_112_part_00